MAELLDRRTFKSGQGPEWRSIPSKDTRAVLRPLLHEFGITRVANVTGLDRIGIPVWQAIRPNGRGLAVAQGKGVSHDLAWASAVMESIESHHAEFPLMSSRIESYRQLGLEAEVVDPSRLPLSSDSVWTFDFPIPWVEGHDVTTGEPAWVPYELVHANSLLPRVPGSGCFVCSTNGLASGNTLAEAVLHGLLEVIERDAHALWWIEDPEGTGTRVDLSTVDDQLCRRLLAQFASTGIDVAVWDMTSDICVPAYRAIITDREADQVIQPTPAAYGAGCHLDPSVALLRALTEAAQSRLTAIAGSRDDLTRARYGSVQSDAAASINRQFATVVGTVDARRHVPATGGPIEDDIRVVVSRLHAVGLRQCIVVDLSRPGMPMAVARVVVPGLEGSSVAPGYRPGRRVHAAIRRRGANGPS